MGWFGPGSGFGRRSTRGGGAVSLYTGRAQVRGGWRWAGGGGGSLAGGPGGVRCDLRGGRCLSLASGAPLGARSAWRLWAFEPVGSRPRACAAAACARARSCESETEREIGLFGLALARVAGLGLPPNERVVLLPALLFHLVFLFILTRKDVRATCTYLIFLPSSNDVIYFIFKNNTHLSSPSIK